MRTYFTITFCLLIFSVQAQTVELEHYCSIDVAIQPETIYPSEPSEDAQKIIDTLLHFIPVERRTISFMAADVNKAIAVIVDGERMIYFNEEYLDEVQQDVDTRWAVYFVLAHELAHHLNVHPLDTSVDRRKTELEADQFAGHILGLMKAPKEKVLSITDAFYAEDTETHPRRSARRQFVYIGWKNGFNVKPPPPDSIQLKNEQYSLKDKNCSKGNYGEIKIINKTNKKQAISININDRYSEIYNKMRKKWGDESITFTMHPNEERIIEEVLEHGYRFYVQNVYNIGKPFEAPAGPSHTTGAVNVKKCTGHPIIIK